jgi:hypothetical protein
MSVNHGLLFTIFRCFAPADDSLSLEQVWLDSNQAAVHQLQKLCDSRKANLLVFGLQEPWSTSSWSRLLQAKEAMDWCPLLEQLWANDKAGPDGGHGADILFQVII